jgi:hypothetical protein
MTAPNRYECMTGAEFMRLVGDDVDKWTDAGIEAAARHGYTVEREWLRSLLADAMDAARRFNRPVVPVTDGYEDDLDERVAASLDKDHNP